jgi:integrase
MASKIGIKQVLAMQPGTIIWDDKVRGFNARRQFSEIVTFSVYFRTQESQQRFFKIGRFPVFTPTEARKQAIRILQNVALGKDPADERKALRNAITLAQLCDEYSAHVNSKKATTIKSDKSRIKMHIKPKLGKYRVGAVTSEMVETFMHSLSPASGKRSVSLLGAIFTWAIKRKMVAVNPCHGIKKPADVKKMRRLSSLEYAQLWRALNGKNIASDIFLLLTGSGWRSGEARLLKWSELDLDRRIASLSDTKSGLSVRPLSNAAVEIIQRQPRTESEYVFGFRSKLPYHWERLGMLKDVTPHSLRHSLASLAADLGFSDHIIAGLLGHSRSSVTSRYIHLEKALIESADAVANETLRLMRT